MQTIAIIGAGSVSFARKLVNDLRFFDAFKDEVDFPYSPMYIRGNLSGRPWPA